MKLLLFKTEINQTAINSLRIARQFFPGNLEISLDYDIDLKLDSIPHKEDLPVQKYSTEELLEYINTLDEPIFVATSNTVFSAECFTAVFGAYQHYSTRFNQVLIQPTFDNDMLAYTTPTLLLYGDRRIYSTSSRITNNPIIVYGQAKTIANILSSDKQILSDGIFYGGETVVLSPMPPLAWNLDKELPVLVTSSEWDAKTYIENLNTIFGQTQKELE